MFNAVPPISMLPPVVEIVPEPPIVRGPAEDGEIVMAVPLAVELIVTPELIDTDGATM